MSLLKSQDIKALLTRLSPDERAALEAYFRGGERIMYARQLFGEKLEVPIIRDRIMTRFEISRRQAYRVIDEALNTR